MLEFSDFAKVGIVALRRGEPRLVQLSLIGSVLSYSLLVTAPIVVAFSCKV